MNAVILLNGHFDGDKAHFNSLFEQSNIYCADGGANIAFFLEMTPKKIIGDMDSISSEAYDYFTEIGVVFEQYDKDKDFSDFELLLEDIGDQYERIYVLGGLGGRTDHSFFNLMLLEHFPNVHFISQSEEVFIVSDEVLIEEKEGMSLSIMPITELIHGVEISGVKFPLIGVDITRGSTRTLSNVIINSEAKVSIKDGKAIVFLHKENLYDRM